jgi:CelD/BcsL family acetyltransferase involved in cellulose biosynthesis
MSTLATHDIVEVSELAELVPEWWELWRRSTTATPFQCPAWLLPWWHAFAPGELAVVTVRDRGRLVGLAPFYVENGHLGRRLLPLGISLSDYLDVLIDRDIAGAVGEALVTHMDEIDKWQACELSELAPGSAALAVPAPSGWDERVDLCNACPVLTLPDHVEDFPRVLPHRKWRNLCTARNRARRRGELAFYQADSRTAADIFAVLVRLHCSRWERRGEPGVLADPRVLQFHREAIPELLQAGSARLYAVQIGGNVVAAYYGFLHGGRAYAYLTGFDPAYSFESPGALAMAHAMEEAVREGAYEFHLLRGNESYKYGWGARDQPSRRRTFWRTKSYARAS